MIIQQAGPTGNIGFTNQGNVHTKGIDFELAGKWRSGWEGRLAYTIQDSQNQEASDPVNNYPKHLPKINLIAPLLRKKLFASFEGQYVSKRTSFLDTEVGGYFVSNATLFVPDVFHGLSLSFSAYNLFDKRYADPGSAGLIETAIPQDGRTLRAETHLSVRTRKVGASKGPQTEKNRIRLRSQVPEANMERDQNSVGSPRYLPSCAATLLLSVFICVIGLPHPPPGSTQGQITAEYQVKAAYLCNFTKFVEWPPGTFPAQDTALTIGIVGEDPFGQALDAEALNITTNGHKMVVQRLHWDQNLRQCQVIFIGRTEKKHLGPILSSLKGASVLTVSEIENFLSSGGMIGLIFDADRIRFEINLDPAADSHLRISSKLLSLARTVKGQPLH